MKTSRFLLTLLLLVGCGTEQRYLPAEQVGRYRLGAVSLESGRGELSLRDLDQDGVPELALYQQPELHVLRVDPSGPALRSWRRRRLSEPPFFRQWADGRLLLFCDGGVRSYDPLTDQVSELIHGELTRFELAGEPRLPGGAGIHAADRPYWRGALAQMLLPLGDVWVRFVEGASGWNAVDRFRVPCAPGEDGTVQFRRHSWTDLDRDGQTDLILHGETQTHLYYRGAGQGGRAGRLPAAPTTSLAAAQTRLADLNDDGFTDLVAVDGAVGRPGKVRVFLGHPRRRAWRTPEQTLTVPGWFRLGPILSDRNGDGQLDLTFLRIEKPSLLGATFNLLFGARFDLPLFLLHYHGLEGGYPAGPSETDDLSLPVDIGALKRVGSRLRARVAHLGDLEKDGRPDLILLSEDGLRLELFYNFRNQAASGQTETQLGAGVSLIRDMFLGLQHLGERRADLTVALPGGPYSRVEVTPARLLRGRTHPDLIAQARGGTGKTRLFVLWSQR